MTSGISGNPSPTPGQRPGTGTRDALPSHPHGTVPHIYIIQKEAGLKQVKFHFVLSVLSTDHYQEDAGRSLNEKSHY